jgi:hypothetical protein
MTSCKTKKCVSPDADLIWLQKNCVAVLTKKTSFEFKQLFPIKSTSA